MSITACANAQDIRTGSTFGSAGFRRAAEEQGRTDYPVFSEGGKGTAILMMFRPNNLDVILVTRKEFTENRTLQIAKDIATALDRRLTDFILIPSRSAAVIDMEFNDYVVSDGLASRADLSISKLVELVEQSQLPKPHIFALRAQDDFSTVRVVSGAKTEVIEGYRFYTADEARKLKQLQCESRLPWYSYPAACFLIMMMVGAPLFVLWTALRPPASLPEPEPLSPERVQAEYDRVRIPCAAVLPIGLICLVAAAFFLQGWIRAGVQVIPPGVSGLLMVYISISALITPIVIWRRRRKHPEMRDPEMQAASSVLWPLGVGMLAMMAVFVVRNQWPQLFFSMSPLVFRIVVLGVPVSMLALSIVLSIRRATRSKTKLAPGDQWYDATMEIARIAGARVRGVNIVNSPSANAYASVAGTVSLTKKLLEELNPDEVKAVIAHEVGHHRLSHPRFLFMLTLIVGIGLAVGWIYFVDWLRASGQISRGWASALSNPLVFIVLIPILRIYLTGKSFRKREFEADAFAVRVVGDAETVISALIKIHTLNQVPHRISKSDEALSTHPSLENRINAIRSYASESR